MASDFLLSRGIVVVTTALGLPSYGSFLAVLVGDRDSESERRAGR